MIPDTKSGLVYAINVHYMVDRKSARMALTSESECFADGTHHWGLLNGRSYERTTSQAVSAEPILAREEESAISSQSMSKAVSRSGRHGTAGGDRWSVDLLAEGSCPHEHSGLRPVPLSDWQTLVSAQVCCCETSRRVFQDEL